MVGLGFAVSAMTLAYYVNPRFDGVGSVAVGVVLVAVAWGLARKVKSLLLGERADPEVDAVVHEAAKGDERIDPHGHFDPKLIELFSDYHQEFDQIWTSLQD